jgi:hypothetical protein
MLKNINEVLRIAKIPGSGNLRKHLHLTLSQGLAERLMVISEINKGSVGSQYPVSGTCSGSVFLHLPDLLQCL